MKEWQRNMFTVNYKLIVILRDQHLWNPFSFRLDLRTMVDETQTELWCNRR